jgi:hypothetical protein
LSADPGAGFAGAINAPLAGFLLLWLFVLLVPSLLTTEGRPHALRAIGAIPPTMILAAIGGVYLWDALSSVRERTRLERRVWYVALALVSLLFAATTRTMYFDLWAKNPNTYLSFMGPQSHVAQIINDTSDEIEKFVVVGRRPKSDITRTWGIAPIVFLTNTALPKRQKARRVRYLRAREIADIEPSAAKRLFVVVDVERASIEGFIRDVAPNATIYQVSGSAPN